MFIRQYMRTACFEAIRLQSYEKSSGEQNKLAYFLSRDGVTYVKLRKNESNEKKNPFFLRIAEC